MSRISESVGRFSGDHRWPVLGDPRGRVFGDKHLSWQCLRRSVLWTATVILVVSPIVGLNQPKALGFVGLLTVLPIQIIVNVLPDYLSLSVVRIVLNAFKRRYLRGPAVLALLVSYAGCLYVATLTAMAASMLGVLIFRDYNLEISGRVWKAISPPALTPKASREPEPFIDGTMYESMIAYMSPSVIVWLYAGSGFLLKAARRFDIGFDWFNRKFDIEKKPLQSIGLVAGAIVAIVYWAAVGISRML